MLLVVKMMVGGAGTVVVLNIETDGSRIFRLQICILYSFLVTRNAFNYSLEVSLDAGDSVQPDVDYFHAERSTTL